MFHQQFVLNVFPLEREGSTIVHLSEKRKRKRGAKATTTPLPCFRLQLHLMILDTIGLSSSLRIIGCRFHASCFNIQMTEGKLRKDMRSRHNMGPDGAPLVPLSFPLFLHHYPYPSFRLSKRCIYMPHTTNHHQKLYIYIYSHTNLAGSDDPGCLQAHPSLPRSDQSPSHHQHRNHRARGSRQIHRRARHLGCAHRPVQERA